MSKAPLPSDKPVKKVPPPPKKPAAAAAAKKPPAGAAAPNKKLPPAVVKAATANASLGANAKLQSKAKQAAPKPAAKPAAAPSAKPKAATPPAASGTKPKAATPPAASGTRPQAATPPAASGTKPKAATPPAASGTKPKAATSPAASNTKPQASPKSTKAFDPQRPLAGFIGPLPKHLEPLRSGQRNLTPQEVQRELSGTGRKVAEIDKRTQEVLARPVDVGKAKRAVEASNGKLRDFYKQAAQGFSGKERETLVGLWNGTRGKRGAELQEAQRKYGEAYQQALSPKQRQQLEKLHQQGTAARERQAEQQVSEGVRRAHQKLQEVQAKRHEQHQTGGDAKALNGQVKKAKEQFKAAQEDVRLFAAAGVQREADSKLLDQQRRSLSASDRKALLGPSKELTAAAKAAQADPKDANKQARLAVTQANFDHALSGRLSPQQRAQMNELATAAKHTRQAAQVVGSEVGAQRELRAAQAAVSAASRKPGGASEVQRRRVDVAQARVTLQAQDRQVRSLADQVLNNPACTPDLGKQYERAQLQNQGLQADLNAAQARHDLARAVQMTDAPVRASKGFGAKPSSPAKSATPAMEATVRLVEAMNQRSQVNAALAPPKVEKPSTLDRGLAVAAGLGEVVGGVALGIATGASGVGLLAGLAIAGDGIVRVGHAVSDWENDTVTDTPQSQFMQGLGMSRDVANRTDAGIALGASLAGGGVAGTVKMVTSGSHLVRGAGLVTGGLLVDTTQAQGRYIAFGDPVVPWTVERMMAAGVDESRANALLVGAGLVASGAALTSAVRARVPGITTAHWGLKRFPNAAAEGGTLATARAGTPTSALAADAPNPAAAAPRLVADAPKPTAAAPKPVADAPKPTAAAPKPVADAPKPTAAAPKPVAGAPKPTAAAPKPGAARDSTAPASPDSGSASAPPASVPKAPAASSSSGRTADWYGPRSSPHDVRMAAAAKFAPNASPKVIAKLARRLDGLPLTVVRDADGNVAAAAALKPNSHGTFGRTLREKVAPNTTMVTHLAGDEAGIAQAVSAAAEGVKRYLPKQKALSLVTDNPQVAASIDAGSVTTRPVIRRSAPEVFANMPEAQRPPGVTEALTPSNGKPLTTQQQLLRLNEIPLDERTAWPIGTQEHSVTVDYNRPLTDLDKLLHPMHPDSYLGKLNSHVNPVRNIIEGVKYLGRVRRGGPTDFQIFPHPQTGRPARVATLYPKGTLQENPALLRELAKAQVEATRPLGDSASINRTPEAERVPSTMKSLAKRDGVIVVSDIDETGAGKPAGLAALTDKFKGHGEDATGQFPFLSERKFQPGTAYLSEVAALGKGGGNQAFLAAVDAARAAGAREMVFHTQGEAAVKMYNRAGAHPPGQSAPEGARLPNLIATHARFGTGAAKVLKNELNLPETERMIPRELRQAVEEKTLPELQRHLEGLGDQLQDMSARVRGGALLTSYRLVYSPNSRFQAMRWAVQDASRPAISAATATAAKLKTVGQRSREAVGPRLDQLKRPVNSALDRLKQPANAVNSALNPYALPHGIEPGPLRGKLQTAGYAGRFLMREGWKTTRATLAVSAAAQAAAMGPDMVKENDDALILPFNGMPGSRSFGMYFPVTGTMVAAWGAGSNFRGVWPLDENGLRPLARVSAPMTDPKGPKGAGFLSAARGAPAGELNAGIRWFGSNSGPSALSAVSLRPMPLNFNLRGDVPVQKGAATNLSALGSVTGLMPSMSHAFYWGPGGVVIRTLHVTMGGSLQAAALSPAARASGYRTGNHYTLGSKGVTGGTGLFFTLNAAYGHPDPSFYG